MTACPCCGAALGLPPLPVLLHDLPASSTAVLETLWAARGLPVTAMALFDAIYADDLDGGPSQARMYRDLREAVTNLNDTLGRSGVIVLYDGRAKGWRLEILEGDAGDLMPLLPQAVTRS